MQTQTRGRAPAGPFVSPTATSTSTSTSAISPLPPPSRPLPSLPLPSLLPAQPQAHAQPRPRSSDETFTTASTRTDVRSSVQTQTQRTSVSVSISVSEIACTSEEGGGKKTKKEKKEKVPKVKKAKEVQEKVKVKQPRFVSVPCPVFRVPCPVSCVSFCFMSRPVIPPSLLCPFRPSFNFRVFAVILPHILLSFLVSRFSGLEYTRLKDSVSVERYPSTVDSLTLTLASPGSAGHSFCSPASDRVQAHAHRILHTSERPCFFLIPKSAFFYFCFCFCFCFFCVCGLLFFLPISFYSVLFRSHWNLLQAAPKSMQPQP